MIVHLLSNFSASYHPSWWTNLRPFSSPLLVNKPPPLLLAVILPPQPAMQCCFKFFSFLQYHQSWWPTLRPSSWWSFPSPTCHAVLFQGEKREGMIRWREMRNRRKELFDSIFSFCENHTVLATTLPGFPASMYCYHGQVPLTGNALQKNHRFYRQLYETCDSL